MMMRYSKKLSEYFKNTSINGWVVFWLLVYLIFVIKLISLKELGDTNLIFSMYGLLVSSYILSRFGLAYFYDPQEAAFDLTYQPTASFGVPTKNEGDKIYEVIMQIAYSKYPKEKFDVIAINDGSTDNTLSEMHRARKDAAKLGVHVDVVDWTTNRGKRDGMAECARRSGKEILVYIDSDSIVERDCLPNIVKYFSNPEVGAVAGQAFVANENTNLLTKMQSVRYYVAFKAYKSAEALFGSVTCCSGCCAAYRRDYVMQVLDEWQNQTFMGVRCTYGDDRSLTNFFLEKGWKAVFAPDATSRTYVPDNMKQYLRQQLRWKKSWLRETTRATKFMWRRHPIMAISFYLGWFLPLMAPIIAVRALIWYPYSTGHFPLGYLLGLALIAIVWGLYYYIETKDRLWILGAFSTTFYSLLLLWQLPYAMLTIRDSRWGTR